ncbi:MAG TPA: G1 family glutamic endopeptidase [Acidimicrobiia bacterium]|jgi:hypothetical protein|nr:G1 family glutamic endopeptidase [Acidimicrobiia bacterium]
MRRSATLVTAAVMLLGIALPIGSAAGAADGTAGADAGPARGITNTALTSRNWAGYFTAAPSRGTDFNAVEATWTQPTVRCEAKTAWTVFWAGLDGWYDGTVEQGGSSARCFRKGGTPQYSLWWEMFPTNAIQTVVPIEAGDTITARVTYTRATKVFTIKVRDTTTGKGFTRQEKCGRGLTCDRSSAEAITEDVEMLGSSGYFPLADYGTMSYSGVRATDITGHSGSISDAHWDHARVREHKDGVTYATVSPLRSNGTAFSVTWKHA